MKATFTNSDINFKVKDLVRSLSRSDNSTISYEIVEFKKELYPNYVSICKQCPPEFDIPQYHLRTEDYFDQFNHKPHSKFLMLKHNEEFIGCASFKKISENGYYFADLKVVPKYRGKGLAERLFTERFKRIPQKKFYILMSTIDGKKRVSNYLNKLNKNGIKFSVHKSKYVLSDHPLNEHPTVNVNSLIYFKKVYKEVYLNKSSFLTKLSMIYPRFISLFNKTKQLNKVTNSKVKITHTIEIKDNKNFNQVVKSLRSYANDEGKDLINIYTNFFPICSSHGPNASITKININVYRHNFNGKINSKIDIAKI